MIHNSVPVGANEEAISNFLNLLSVDYLHDSMQTVAVLIDDVRERTFVTAGNEVCMVICIGIEESSVEDVTETTEPIKQTKLVGKDPVYFGNLLVAFEREDEVVPKLDETALNER